MTTKHVMMRIMKVISVDDADVNFDELLLYRHLPKMSLKDILLYVWISCFVAFHNYGSNSMYAKTSRSMK